MLHWHEEIQFVAVQKGVVHFKIWEKEYELSEGSCMFINCNVLHHISEKQDCSYHSFLIPPKMLGFFEEVPWKSRRLIQLSKILQSQI